MAQNTEFYNTELDNINDLPNVDHVRLYRNKNIAQLRPDPTAPFQIKHSDGTLEPLGGNGTEIGLIEVTYAELMTLVAGSALIQGGYYLITDFATRHIIPNTTDINQGPTEPLIVQANSTNTISENAISQNFGSDIIWYELVDSTTAGGDKGRIYYRKDTIKKNETYYDWRVVLFRRWDDGSGNFTVLTDNGNAFNDYYTFNNSSSATGCESNIIGPITDEGITDFSAPTDKLNNLVINSAAYQNIFYSDCFNSTITGTLIGVNFIDSNFQNNVIGDDFSNNKIGKSCTDNIIASSFSDNIIGSSFSGNTIGDLCASNKIGNVCQSNTIGTSFQNNTIGNSFQSNVIGNQFSSNVIFNVFNDNAIGANCLANTINSGTNNTIGTTFNRNFIGADFSNNVIGNGFANNSIGNTFQTNTNIGNNFQKNHIESGITTINFGAATHVYNNYTCNLFRRSDGTNQLSYIDNTNTVQYTAVNA